MLSRIWNDYIAPLLGRPARFQVAALCYRREAGALRVLVITSLTTKRWIIPKGWPIVGLDAGGSAQEEAWEEAGIKGTSSRPRRIGRYRYEKLMSGGVPTMTDVDVYAVEVEEMMDTYPEAGSRRREWVTPEEAAQMVDEPQLKSIFTGLSGLFDRT